MVFAICDWSHINYSTLRPISPSPHLLPPVILGRRSSATQCLARIPVVIDTCEGPDMGRMFVMNSPDIYLRIVLWWSVCPLVIVADPQYIDIV